MSVQRPTRQLGKNGPHVTALGFGVMGLSFEWYGKPLPEEEQLDFSIEPWKWESSTGTPQTSTATAN